MTVGPTLGWRVLDWIADNLPSPADPTREFILTDEQAELVLRWYAVDERGDFLFRRGALEMAKGWGKSPLAAAVALAEFAGPVVFDHWQGTDPVGKPWFNPWVQIAAVSEDQTDNTYNALYEMLVADEHRAAKALGIDDGRTRLYLKGRPGVLEPVTASAGSREGQRLTFSILDETHLWTRRNGGVKLAGTLRRNVAKMGGRTLETTNAPLLGEKSVAEQSGLDPGVMHYARRPAVEPDTNWPDERLREALREAYGDASWIDLDRLVAEIRDPATSWDDATRYYFNIRSAGAGRAVDPRVWDALAKPRDVPSGTRVGLGFDGSISQDATVLRACTADGYSFIVRSWVRPKGAVDWRVNRLEVAEAVAETFARYDVGLMMCDPFKWWTEVETWADRFGEDIVIALETNQARRFAPPVDRWLTAIREGSHTHDADPLTDLHVKASHLQKVRITDEEDDGRTRYVLIKGDDHGRIDGAVADVLAYEAAMTMPEATPMREFASAWA
jgi:phage terminase large subunit-like protein